MNRILIGATNSGAGKTTISMGIMAALKERGMKVQPFKVGPDYIDTSYHSFITGRKSRNLDSFMIDDEKIKYLFEKNSKDADISVVEGVMGLYDGFGLDIDNCTSSYTSKILKAPVILIIDGSGMATSAAAMVKGYMELDKSVDIQGVIINKLGSKSHYEMIKSAIERYTDAQVLGYLPKNLDFSLPSRHLGLIPSLEMDELNQKFEDLGKIVEEHIDIDKIIEISQKEWEPCKKEIDLPRFDDITVAIAYDKSFNFYYWDSLDLLEDMGAKIVRFSPLEDTKLPECDCIYIGGGFPEIFGKELEANGEIRRALKMAHEKNIPIYAECGGLMYLGEKLVGTDGQEYEMLGLLKGKSIMTKRLKRFGYSQGIAKFDTVISKKGQLVRGHEFHHSDFETDETAAYEIEKNRDGKVLKQWEGGFAKENLLGTYLHTHFYSNMSIASNFLELARRQKKERE